MITLSKLSMRYGAKILFKEASLQLLEGKHYGLVGANGSGKTTLLRILSGEISPEKGDVSLPNRTVIGTLKQDHDLIQGIPILTVVLQGNKVLSEAITEKQKLLSKDNFDETDSASLAQHEKIIETHQGYSAESTAAQILEGLGIETTRHHEPIDNFSGGYKLRVLLAQVLFSKPDVLFLDEPTNHLDIYSIKWLENYLKNFSGTLLLTSHDRDFLNGVCSHIVDIDYGTLRIYPGNYDQFEKQKEKSQEHNQTTLENLNRKKEHLEEFIDRFGAKATKAKQAQSKARLVEKIDQEIAQNSPQVSNRIPPKLQFTPIRASGISVLKVNAISKAYETKKVLENVSFEIERGEKVALIGPNGIGKSTLLEILTHHLLANKGNFEWGFETKIAYFPQDHKREVHGSFTLLEWLSQFSPNAKAEELRALLGTLLFSGDSVDKSISCLSGGETARLLLAKIILQKPNVLIFDEPTNHLDIQAIDALLQACISFNGTLIFVSHNRYFVSHLASRIIELTSEGTCDFKGSYVEFLEKKERDHLNRNVILSRRNESKCHVQPSGKEAQTESYEERKKIKNAIALLQKKIISAEEKCHRLEISLKKLEMTFADEKFYINASREDQMALLKQKTESELQLDLALQEWELLNHELSKIMT